MAERPNRPFFIDLSTHDAGVLSKLAKGSDTRTKRAHDILSSLFLMQDFKLFVQTVRKKLGIPAEGYSRNKIMMMNATAYSLDTGKELTNGKKISSKISGDILMYIIGKKHIDSIRKDMYELGSWLEVLESYIIFSDVEVMGMPVAKLSYKHVDGFNDCLEITFRPDVRIDELKKFIDEYRNVIREYGRMANLNTPKSKRLKPNLEFERDVHIFNKYQEKLFERRKFGIKSDEAKKYLEQEVASYIKEYLGLKIKSDATKKAYDRIYKKFKQVNF